MMTEIQPQVNNEQYIKIHSQFNPLNAELNLICHLLALLGAHHILHVSRIRVTVLLTCIVIYPYNMNQQGALFSFNLFH